MDTTNEVMNGMYLCNHHIPEEVLTLIFSNIVPGDLLNLSLVCKSWNSVIKSNSVWIKIFKQKYSERKVKQLPWYIYYVLFTTKFFDSELKQTIDVAKTFKDSTNAEDTNTVFRCSGNSWYSIQTYQKIDFSIRKVYTEILQKYKPHFLIHSDYPSHRKFGIQILDMESELKEYWNVDSSGHQANADGKMQFIVDDYPDNIKEMYFVHEECWTYNWSSVKILFDTLK